MFILGQQARFRAVIGDIEERCRKLKTGFGEHWTARMLHFWANGGARVRKQSPFCLCDQRAMLWPRQWADICSDVRSVTKVGSATTLRLQTLPKSSTQSIGRN